VVLEKDRDGPIVGKVKKTGRKGTGDQKYNKHAKIF
jgi:hypothetical protein